MVVPSPTRFPEPPIAARRASGMFAQHDVVKVLLVSHSFPPLGTAGTETYTADLAVGLRARGHATEVFTAAKDISLEDLTLRTRTWRTVPVHELVNNLYYADFRQTWEHPAIERTFAEVLDRVRPDLVHFQHLMYLSAGCVELAHARGLPVVFTLHDYWLQCPRFGQRVHADGAICDTIDHGRCGTCLARFKFGQSPIEKRVGSLVAGVRSGTGINLAPIVRGAAGALNKGEAGEDRPEGAAELERAMAESARLRTETLRTRIVPLVDEFISPSRFLRERFMREWGLPAERIRHVPFGVDLAAFGARERTRSTRPRVAFIGSLVPLKGPHVLLEAWARLPPALRDACDLELYGPARHHPEYRRQLAERARAVGARLAGPLERGAVAEVLAQIDLLVVPSLWFENSPLIIHEARAAGTPLLVSDLGGMAELVREGVDGRRFRIGDAADLARQLQELLSDREQLAQLGRAPFEAPSFHAHVVAIEERYRALVAGRSYEEQA
jgi:glycosyltransferase involved in cell wall biosynthesis